MAAPLRVDTDQRVWNFHHPYIARNHRSHRNVEVDAIHSRSIAALNDRLPDFGPLFCCNIRRSGLLRRTLTSLLSRCAAWWLVRLVRLASRRRLPLLLSAGGLLRLLSLLFVGRFLRLLLLCA